jgi:hypothetical protein
MFGYWVNSVTVDEVDQLELEWQDYDHFKGKLRVSPIQGVCNVKFPVCELGKETRVATTIQLTQFPARELGRSGAPQARTRGCRDAIK